MMRNLKFNASVLLLMTILSIGCNNNQNKTNIDSTMVFSFKNMDLNVKPGDDFFDYVNANWIKAHPIPPEKSTYGTSTEMWEKNGKDILEIIKEVSNKKNVSKCDISQKIRDLYNSGMDTVLIEQLDLKPLDDLFTMIDNIKTITDVQEVASHLQLYGVGSFFYVFAYPDFKNSKMMIANTYQAGIGLPDRDYYLRTDEASRKIREEYILHLTKMFELLDDKPELAQLKAKKIMEIEFRFAKASFTNVENQDPKKTDNKLSISELENLTPDFNWRLFFKNIGYPNISEINIFQPSFIKELNKMMKSVPINDWKTFLIWKLLKTYSPYLSAKFEKQNFSFYQTALLGVKAMLPRWKKTLNVTSDFLGEPIGQLYVKKFFPPEAKQRMLVLTNNLKKSLRNRIENLTWMGSETKNEALAKLDNMNVKIGYPDKWRDYSGLDIKSDDYVGNIMRSYKFDFIYDMDKVGKAVDKTEWDTTPQTIDAYYDRSKNEIIFPAGILQPPLFNLKGDDAINYGSIGFFIGHEMTHGFDNTGRKFDKDGNLRNWWTDNDSKIFESRTSVLVDQFNKYEVLDSMFINGKLTLGENIADLGGLTIAYHAFQILVTGNKTPKKIDGFSANQRFFLSYAQCWRGSRRAESLKNWIKTNEHSPEKYRVNGPIFNMPEFYEAFPEIGPHDRLFIPVEHRAVIW